MAWTEVQICNLALLHVGHTKKISDLAERSTAAEVCSLAYENARDVTLEAFPWPEATKYATLGLIEEEPNDDWTYMYQYPDDCVFARRLVTGLGRRDPNPPAFITGYAETGRVIYTHQEEAVLEYTLRLDDPALFRPALGDAISWYLAFLIAPGLSKEPKIANDCFKVWQAMTSRAEARAGNEQQQTDEPDSEFIRSRS